MWKRDPIFRIHISEAGRSRSQETNKTSFVIGRGDASEVQIPESSVSRSHINVELKNGKIWIKDLGSGGGTFINGRKLAPNQAEFYPEGAEAKLGSANIVVRIILLASQPEASPEAAEENSEQDLTRTLVDSSVLTEIVDPSPSPKTEDVLETAKAAALKIKIGVELEAAKILQDAKGKALSEINSAREKAEEIVSKAMDQALKIQKEGEAEAIKMRQGMQETIERVHLETEQRAETFRKESREKGEKALTEARLSAAKIKADAQQEADSILSQAQRKSFELKNSWEAEAKNFQKEEQLKSEKLLASAQVEADHILEEARQSSSSIRANIEKDVSEIQKNARFEADTIKSEAQKEADRILNLSRAQIDSQVAQMADFKKKTEEETESLKLKAQKDALAIRLQAQAQAEQISEKALAVLKEAEESSIQIAAEARIEAEKMTVFTKEQAERQKLEVLQGAEEEAIQIKDEANREAKKEALRLLRKAESDRSELIETLEKLEQEVLLREKEKAEIIEDIKASQKKNSAIKDKFEELTTQIAQAEVETNQQTEKLREKILATENLLGAKVGELEKNKKENQEILDTIGRAETLTKKAQEEKEKLTEAIGSLRHHQVQLTKDLQVHSQQMDSEKLRRKEAVEIEIKAFKDQSNAEIKGLREKVLADFNQRKSEQEAELTKMRMTELETIKGLRAEEDRKFLAGRKHQVLEIAKALETYLVPRLKEELKWKEVPQPLMNIFPELKNIVARVLEDEFKGFSDVSRDNGAQTNSRFSNKMRRNAYLGLGLGVTVILALFLVPFGDPGKRKPASELYIERLRDKEAQKPKFTPKMTEEFKGSYTDNVIYTKDYVEFKMDPSRQTRWIQDLNKLFVNDLGLNENAIVKFISIESNLVGQLKNMRDLIHYENQNEEIRKMRDLEKDTTKEMLEVLGTQKKYESFREFEKTYYSNNRQPAGS